MKKLTFIIVVILSGCAHQTPIKPAAQNQYESDLQLCESMAGHVKAATVNSAAGQSDTMSFGLGIAGGAVGGVIGSLMDTHMTASKDPNYHKSKDDLIAECMANQGYSESAPLPL